MKLRDTEWSEERMSGQRVESKGNGEEKGRGERKERRERK